MTAGVRRGLALARGDYLDRVRRPAFLVSLAFMIYAAYVFLPPVGASYVTFDLSGYRIRYSSAAVGGLVALLSNAFITLAGFYIVKGTIERDRRSGVGGILGATSLGTTRYLASKWASNVAVLASMLVVLWIAAAAMQLILGEDPRLDVVALVEPLLGIALPSMVLVATIAVAFECVPGLRGGLGNAVYFFMWCAMLGATLSLDSSRTMPDPLGNSLLIQSMVDRAREQYPGVSFGADQMSIGINVMSERMRATPRWIDWGGVRWTPASVAERFLWVAVAATGLALAARAFDRFAADAPAAAIAGRRRGRRRHPVSVGPESADAIDAGETPSAARPAVRPGSLDAPVRGSAIGALVRAEWALLARGGSRWWWWGAAGLIVAGAVVPAAARGFVMMGAWIWPIFRWSELGSRERRHGVSALLFSTPQPILRPIAAAWLAGAALSLAVAAGVIVRVILSGDWLGLVALVTGGCFVPAFALAAGTWSGGTKLFEGLYLLLWYVGPANRVAALDFTGTAPGAGGEPAARFAVATLALLALAALGRAGRLRG